jgi:uncharacterized membrane protein YeaQ/YmgE (transglycosylase-associated protein family)
VTQATLVGHAQQNGLKVGSFHELPGNAFLRTPSRAPPAIAEYRVAMKERRSMGIIEMLVFGLVVGAIARLVVPGPDPMGWFATLCLGLVGAFVGGILFRYLFNEGIGLFGAVIGAILVLLIYNTAFRSHRLARR